jgi:hypothetical protein
MIKSRKREHREAPAPKGLEPPTPNRKVIEGLSRKHEKPDKEPPTPQSTENDYKIKDSGERRDFGTGAVRDMASGKGRFDLLPWAVIRAIAIHYQKGCEKYGDRNWENGIPVHSFLDSAIRHASQVIDGRNDENHLVAAIWNLICAYQTILWIQEGKFPVELYDLPRKVTLPDPYGEYGIDGWVDGKPDITSATESKLDEWAKNSKKDIKKT